MFRYLTGGWLDALRQSFALVVLFLYQLLWTVVLYRMVESVVVPLLRSYPGGALPAKNLQVYWYEAQFRLLKTDVSHPWLWTLAIAILLRMLLTPALNAGVFAAFRNEERFRARSFVFGIRRRLKPFCLLYLAQLALMLAPLYWLLPLWHGVLFTGSDLHALEWRALPLLGGYILYLSLIRLVFTYCYFGCVERRSLLYSLLFIGRHLLPAAAIAAILFALLGFAAVAAVAASLYWAGLAAILLHLLFPLVRVLFNLWQIGAQYELWTAKKAA